MTLSLLVLVLVAGEESVLLQVRRRLRQGSKFEQVDEVEVLEPVGPLAVGQVRVEPAEELVQVGAVVLVGGRGVVVEGLLESGKRRRRVPALVLHHAHGVEGRQVDGDAGKNQVGLRSIGLKAKLNNTTVNCSSTIFKF